MTLIAKFKNLFRRRKPPTPKPTYQLARIHVVSDGLVDKMRDDYARQLAREYVDRMWSMRK